MKWTTLCFYDENIFFPGLGWNHFSVKAGSADVRIYKYKYKYHAHFFVMPTAKLNLYLSWMWMRIYKAIGSFSRFRLNEGIA